MYFLFNLHKINYRKSRKKNDQYCVSLDDDVSFNDNYSFANICLCYLEMYRKKKFYTIVHFEIEMIVTECLFGFVMRVMESEWLKKTMRA